MHPTPQRRLPAVLIATALWMAGGLPPAEGSTPEARLLEVRWRDAGPATLVTAHLTAPVRYRTLATPGSVAVDLWAVGGQVERSLSGGRGVAGTVVVRRLTPQIVRLEIRLREAVRHKVFMRGGLLTVSVFPVSLGTVPVPQSVAYRALRVPTGAGRARVHVVQLDPRGGGLDIRPALGGAAVAAMEATSTAATRLEAVAAINGSFYSRAGLPLGLVVIDERLLSAPLPRRAVFTVDHAGRTRIGPARFRGRLVTDTGMTVPISTVNRPPKAGGVALYTPEFGPLTPRQALVVLVRGNRVAGFSRGRPAIPPDGYALAATRSEQALLLGLVRGQAVRLHLDLSPAGIRHAVQGGPQLVRDGRIFIPYAWEGFSRKFHGIRTARSAIGVTAAGKVLFVTVDGRGRESTGMSLPELAALLQALGAREAMNLDGGGSATLVVGGRVVSALPRGGERIVSSMVVALTRPDDRSP